MVYIYVNSYGAIEINTNAWVLLQLEKNSRQEKEDGMHQHPTLSRGRRKFKHPCQKRSQDRYP